MKSIFVGVFLADASADEEVAAPPLARSRREAVAIECTNILISKIGRLKYLGV
jgi:hypothetical protein